MDRACICIGRRERVEADGRATSFQYHENTATLFIQRAGERERERKRFRDSRDALATATIHLGVRKENVGRGPFLLPAVLSLIETHSIEIYTALGTRTPGVDGKRNEISLFTRELHTYVLFVCAYVASRGITTPSRCWHL